MTRASSAADYYTLLSIPPPPHPLPPFQVLKKAYHAALLRHHPDKAKPQPKSNSRSSGISLASPPTIDTIATAYKTLSTPELRAAYNRSLLNSGPDNSAETTTTTTGNEVVQYVDLDEFEYLEPTGEDGSTGRFVKACRCGETEGFVLTEKELESAPDGDVMVGCVGCSLWWRVGFEVIDVSEA
jgi:curved DNA-binding protein CbpA